MQFEDFALERIQSLYENTVRHNLSDSGVHPYSLRGLLTSDEITTLTEIELGYGWTNGAVELRETISRLYAGRSAEEVLVTNGSAEALFVLGAALLEPGDEVIMVVPNYLLLSGWAKAIGVVLKPVVLRESRGWKPDFADIETAVTPRTKLISICTPNNPTGSVMTAAEMHQLVEIARRHGLWLHADEVYKGSEMEQDEPDSFADLYEKAVVTNGLSKAMALPGLRIGWLVGPEREIAEAWARKDYTSITTGALSEYIARLVLEPARRHTILARSKGILRENLALLQGWVQQNQRFSLVPPKAGGMAFLRYDLPIGSTDLAHRLREEESVLVLPGDVYGMDGYIRLGIGAPKDHIVDGLDHLGRFTARLG